jgi:CRP-like cAMP-binding protein
MGHLAAARPTAVDAGGAHLSHFTAGMKAPAHSTPSTHPSQPNALRSPTRDARAHKQLADASALAVRALLRSAAALSELDDAMIDRLAEWCDTLEVREGELLFKTGDECAGLYVVDEGQVRIYRTRRDGTEQPQRVVGRGQSLGDLPLTRGERHAASAVATAPTRLVFLSRHAVEGLYRRDPEVAHAIIESLARRLRDLGLRVQVLAFRDVLPRLALLLAGYSERRGTPTPDGGVELDLGRTQEELAHEIGAARESVSRALGQLRDQRLVEPRRGHRVYIPDVQRLRDVAGV